MLPLYLSDNDYAQPSPPPPAKCPVPDGDSLDDLHEVRNKADKRQREKMANFAFKTHTNVYYKPEWVCAPGYDYPGPQHIPHKLITAARADKIVGGGEYKAKRAALSKKKARRPSKYVFEPEQEDIALGNVRTYPVLWGISTTYTGDAERWPRGKPFSRTFAQVASAK